MKGPSLQKTAAVSAALHATIFLLSMIALRNTRVFMMPSPYTVNLVSLPGGAPDHSGAVSPREAAKAAPEPVKVSKKDKENTKEQQKRIDDSIAVLKSKKKIEKIVEIRKAMVSIGGVSNRPKSSTKSDKKPVGAGTPGGLAGEETYADKVGQEIEKSWSYPDNLKKNFETVVMINISRDGTVSIKDIEKKSGDRLFDRSVLKAIESASPVSRPPYDSFELGLRFGQKK
ncbi:MAG: cell envelope integrity protein TolA [Nitrospirae bacterium]|nr:cell envelope integrity protein TolA [Nitrospirota bacterium]